MKTTTLKKASCVGLTLSMLTGFAACSTGASETSEATNIQSQIEKTAEKEAVLN